MLFSRSRRLLATSQQYHTNGTISYSSIRPSTALCCDALRGNKTPITPDVLHQAPRSPFYFDAGHALFAKRASRPFPPPFVSPTSPSFSDPLTTHDHSRDRRSFINGEIIRGITNGDDAVLIGENFIGANDGVGAWSTREKGHAALWSRLILHFWASEAERDLLSSMMSKEPDPIQYLQKAYEQTIAATSSPNKWNGTTTACAALLHHSVKDAASIPTLYVTNLGDSQCLVLRLRDGNEGNVIYKTLEQWHWFDCPRQLGTNSPDTPNANAVMDRVEIQENDIILAMSDGVADNLWEHEILENVFSSIQKWEAGEGGDASGHRTGGANGGMLYVAEQLVKAARDVAENPYAESPFMERAIEEGLAMEGGKLDDISVVAALCRKREVG